MSVSVYKLESGRWRCDVAVNGLRKSKVWRLKAEAMDWGRAMERELALAEAQPSKLVSVVTVQEAFEQYAQHQSPLKKTGAKEAVRIAFLVKEMPFAGHPLPSVTSEQISHWQRSRKHLAANTILRDYSIIGVVFEWARMAKQWITVNPVRDAWKPPAGEHRDRRIQKDEIPAMLAALTYQVWTVPKNKKQEIGLIWLIALVTGMRSGEIVNRLRGEVNLAKRFVFIPSSGSKTGKQRLVPLDELGMQLWSLALSIKPTGKSQERVWRVADGSRDAMWRKARSAAGLDGLNLKFHDSRHEAASLLAKRIPNALTLCKVMGWSKTDQALTYYNPSNDELVSMLDSTPQHRLLPPERWVGS